MLMLNNIAPVLAADPVECTFAQGWWEDPAYAIDLESEIDASE